MLLALIARGIWFTDGEKELVMIEMAPLEVRFTPQGEYWLASCTTLNIATQGKSFEEAQYNLKDAIFLFFESCQRRGVLAQVLEEAGLEPVRIKQVEDYLAEYVPEKMPHVSPQCRA